MVKLILSGNPISTNNCYYHAGRGITFMKANAKKLKNEYLKQIKKQYRGTPIETDVEIFVKIYFGDKRKHDWDNFHKISQDCLNKIVLIDDVQIQKATVEKFYDRLNPRIEIDVYSYPHAF